MMAGYFSYFPKILYTFDKNTLNQQLITNIFARSTFLKSVAENAAVYFKYSVKDSDTPEIIAHKIYGDPFRSWIVLLFNNITDPHYGWVKPIEVLKTYIEKKYDQTLEQSKNTIHHYELTVVKTVKFNSMVISENTEFYTVTDKSYSYVTALLSDRVVPTVPDTSTNETVENILLTNGNTLTITSSIKAVSNYAYEVAENEKLREIRLLDTSYIPKIESEFKQLMENG